MPSLKSTTTIKEWQDFSCRIYGLSNDRDFGIMEIVSNINRFAMRALKGIRKRDDVKTKFNLLISISWFISLMNQFHINLEDAVWHRFPYVCSYCGTKPCSCKAKKVKRRQKINIEDNLKPKTLAQYQDMLSQIYPPESRSLENGGIHLAEELGELSEAITAYKGSHTDEDFKQIILESADLFSVYIGVFNSLNIDVSKDVSKMFSNNCHDCHKAPCQCNFKHVMRYRS